MASIKPVLGKDQGNIRKCLLCDKELKNKKGKAKQDWCKCTENKWKVIKDYAFEWEKINMDIKDTIFCQLKFQLVIIRNHIFMIPILILLMIVHLKITCDTLVFVISHIFNIEQNNT